MNAFRKLFRSFFLIFLFFFSTQISMAFSVAATLVSPSELKRLATDIKEDKDYYSRLINSEFPNLFSPNTDLIDKIISFPEDSPRTYLELVSYASQTWVMELNRTNGDGNLYHQGKPSDDFEKEYYKLQYILEIFQLKAKTSKIKIPIFPESLRLEGLRRDTRTFWNRLNFP